VKDKMDNQSFYSGLILGIVIGILIVMMMVIQYSNNNDDDE